VAGGKESPGQEIIQGQSLPSGSFSLRRFWFVLRGVNPPLTILSTMLALMNSQRSRIMYLSLIITFLLLLVIIIASIQNSIPLELKFAIWILQISLTALIIYSSIVGAAIVAVLSLPKLVSKYFKVRSLNKEIIELKKEIVGLEKQSVAEFEGK
jgi:uncharacterized integral membrane protein